MIDANALAARLGEFGLDDWIPTLQPLLLDRFSSAFHGDFDAWQDTVATLPSASDDKKVLKDLLLRLSPWRKGPFDVAGVHIDSEWRSDLKWARLAGQIDLQGRNVLDVGCGNGYYARQMRQAGAASVLGVDPTLLFVMQHLAIDSILPDPGITILPLRLHELPLPTERFDTTFSMGVLYHQRSPIDHLRQLRQSLRPGGTLILETIYVPGEESYACTPSDRYARMRNVWLLPTLAELTTWLRRSGYRDIEIIDVSVTSTDEQRATEWMTFESLREALDADDPTRTIEGWPAPHRAVLTATTP